MEKPLLFQMVVATVAIGGAVLLTTGEPPSPSPAFTLQDDSIDESSGLVDLGDSVLTVNDSGSGPEIYVVDKESGETVGRTTYTSDEVVDVEALAPGPEGTVWVGDIGDNGGRRMSVAAYELATPEPGDRTVTSTRYDLAYRDGPRDAEALLVDPSTGRLHVVTKGLFGGRVYAAPRRLSADRVNVLRPVGDAPGLVTDGAFLPDGRHVLLRTYATMAVHDARTWSSVASAELPDQPQGEGLAISPSGRSVLVSTEGANTDVLSVELGGRLRTALAPPASPPLAPVPSGPAEDGGPDTARVVGLSAAGLVAATAGVLVWRTRARARRQSRSTT